MKLVIQVNKEDYKRYKEDKVCSYASAVLDAVPFNEVLDEIIAEIEKDLSHFCFDDWGNENSTWKEVKAIIDKHKEESEDK